MRLSVIFLTAVFAALLLAAAGCASGKDAASNENAQSSYDYAAEKPLAAMDEYENGYAPQAQTTAGSITVATERKVIETANLSIETETFDSAETEARRVAADYGGYVQNGTVTQSTGYGKGGKESSKSAYITLRVPNESYAVAIGALELLGKVTSKSTGSNDVTSQYTDMESRLEIKKTEETRLLAMIDSTDNFSTLIMLEQRLSDIRSDIEVYNGRINRLDALASYATINLSLNEVLPSGGNDARGFGARIISAFKAGAHGCVVAGQWIIVFFAGAIIPIVFIAALLLVAWIIFRKLSRSRKTD